MNFTVPLNLTYANWTAPPLSELDFSTNCTVTAEFARMWLAGEKGVNYAATSAYFRQALPPSLRGLPTRGQLIDWFLVLVRTQQAYNIENPYNGSNARSTVLATVLGLVPIWEWILRRRGITPGRRQQHIIDSFNATLGTFVDACLLLSFSSSLAGIVLIDCRDFDGGGTLVTLIWAISLFYFNAICFPALLDEVVHRETQRKEGKYVFLFTCVVLHIVVVNMATPLMDSLDYVSSWELYCIPDAMLSLRMVVRNLAFTTAIGMFFWLFVFGLGPVACDTASVGARLRRWRKMIRAWLALTSFVLLWCMLVFITVIRQLLLDRSGFNSGDSKWTLGQFFALGAWLPVLMEVGSLLYEGVEEGLDGRAPDGWTVVRTDRLAVTLTGGGDDEVELLAESRKPLRGQTWSIVATGDANDVEQSVPRSTTC
ncbi:hypothetical protein CPLU01_10026 [Colletotrichum plurivorum]|uniref:Uncharacterized protein n=1 Tax=Colletotrichum plurivorum TaxID=2175906 RepID=A0A8H6NA46_9PEZI|nr:hypothetical protein CPLU01_10026 [Colletotrichum plurivorum]